MTMVFSIMTMVCIHIYVATMHTSFFFYSWKDKLVISTDILDSGWMTCEVIITVGTWSSAALFETLTVLHRYFWSRAHDSHCRHPLEAPVVGNNIKEAFHTYSILVIQNTFWHTITFIHLWRLQLVFLIGKNVTIWNLSTLKTFFVTFI
jgi:hypothetical protein